MQQKIIQIGNSTGIIIPKSLLDQVGLQTGNEVEIQENKNDNSLIIFKKGMKTKSSSINNHFLNILDKVNKQYRSALKELAGK
ncbi:MAG TPA: AbrB/MazE/SpoVT family DNA-binding domain-containing protein [Methylomirabilota bacterium]|nr:AbrB/MazE/SpoVT family DNA-binding domain-containing protein [Methylomirabilota bacterium]